MSAIINTAQGFTKALAQGGIFGAALGATVLALGAAQTALIAKQPLPAAQEGAIIPGSGEGTALIAGENNRSEAIVPLEGDAETGIGGGGTINIYVENLNGNEDLPPAFVQAVDRSLTQLKQDGNSTFAETITL